MEIIIKNKDGIFLTNIPDNEIELIEGEVIKDIPFTEEEKQKIYAGCTINEDMTITETPEYLENISKEASIQKSKDINALFGEEDKLEAVIQQINLIAEVLDTVTSENPSQETIAYAKSKFGEVRNILTK